MRVEKQATCQREKVACVHATGVVWGIDGRMNDVEANTTAWGDRDGVGVVLGDQVVNGAGTKPGIKYKGGHLHMK